MRWLFLVMLVLNLSYVAWEVLNSAENETRVNAPPLPDVPTILLADERPGMAFAAPEKKALHAPVVEVGREQIAQQLPVDDAGAKTITAAGKPVASALPVEQGRVSDGVNENKDETTAKEALRVKAESPDACFTLGPFRKLDTLRGLTRNIKEYVEEVSFRSRDEKEPSLFWVYLPSLDSRAKASQVGQQLKAKKIKDFYIIRSGDKKNGISLGQFRNKSGAYRLAEKVMKLGFTVEVEPIIKTYTLYWLDYRMVNGRLIPDEIMAKHLTDEISRLSRSCESPSSEVL